MMPFLPGSVYPTHVNRRMFIGGSDARIIMGQDEATLVRLWREKRGEAEPPDYSGNLLVQLGLITEPLNRRWFEKTTGRPIKDVQTWIRHPVLRWMAATLDGIVEGRGGLRGEIYAGGEICKPRSFRQHSGARSPLHASSHHFHFAWRSGRPLYHRDGYCP